MRFLLAAGMAAVLMGLSASANAQGVPEGSYRRTCTNVRMDGETLKALCRNNKGSAFVTELHHPERCAGDIANINGILQCQPSAARPGTPGPGYGPAPAPGYGPGPAPGYSPGPGGPPPGYGPEHREGWQERCEHLRHRAHEIRERLRQYLSSDERREQEHRLWETREEYRNDRCGEWHD